MPDEPERAESAPPVPLSVVVKRSGGVAGVTRQWRVDAVADESSAWEELVDRCPWGTPKHAAPTGADRFWWTVSAHRGDDRRRAELAEYEIDGPWKVLIDAVRGAAGAERAGSAGAPPEE
ncbi:protealysin inhibitor emfourin [Microbacterium sp.]|uniref:protealysin inhibitor emfourin n=1 Tax=Microbacterium sp. TaxID=51671 RepID=UPI0025FB9EBD|nr:protealysin inhibitor emfourin [Microbacterium sp.]